MEPVSYESKESSRLDELRDEDKAPSAEELAKPLKGFTHLPGDAFVSHGLTDDVLYMLWAVLSVTDNSLVSCGARCRRAVLLTYVAHGAPPASHSCGGLSLLLLAWSGTFSEQRWRTFWSACCVPR